VRRVYLLGVFIPVAIALDHANASDTAIFFAAALGIVPTAQLMSDATEALAERAGPGIGGLLNVTFGNAPELIIAIFALADGLHEVVKASLVGSVMGNVLLVMGFAMLTGGLRQGPQQFTRELISAQSRALLATVVVLVALAIARAIAGGGLPGPGDTHPHYSHALNGTSLVVALGLLLTYAIGLGYDLRHRRGQFTPVTDLDAQEETWSVRTSVGLLALAGVLVGVMSDVLVHSIVGASRSVGLSPFFIGVFVVGIAGNAAEHWVAVVVAMKNKMDLALSIAIGSSVQIAMFVVSLLVLLSFVVGPHPMALVFNGYEIAGLLMAGAVAALVTRDGRSTWQEGVVLLVAYAGLGVLFALA
jgi:Ca2+:H+ antiporter